jgi:hypothetical protein
MLKFLIPVSNTSMVYSHYLKTLVPDDYSVRQVWNYEINDDDLVYPDMAVYSKYHFTYLIREQAVYSEFYDDYIYKGIAVYNKLVNSYISKNDRRFTTIDGKCVFIPRAKRKKLYTIIVIKGIHSDFYQPFRGLTLKKATCPSLLF